MSGVVKRRGGCHCYGRVLFACTAAKVKGLGEVQDGIQEVLLSRIEVCLKLAVCLRHVHD